MTGSTDAISACTACAVFEGTTAMLETDGYELSVDDGTDGRLRVLMSATPEARDECLVPKPIMAGLISAALSDFGAGECDLFYPRDPRP